jgi:antitoxin component of RelBE/YafQ-DinJ toxin-antitoxin module
LGIQAALALRVILPKTADRGQMPVDWVTHFQDRGQAWQTR